jgi:carbonic anhydrase
MNPTRIFRLFCVVLFFFSFALVAPGQSKARKADPTPLFAYDNGPSGQSTWTGVCNSSTRHFQAPINVPSSQPNPALRPIRFVGYGESTPLTTTMTNPHNLKIYTLQKQNSIEVPGLGTYRLDEFHFHRPSEEAVNGHRYPMVIHLVHLRDNCTVGEPNCVVVIAVLVEEGQPGANTTELLNLLFQRIPPPAITNGTPAKLEGLLPDGYQDAGYYRFPGSLTTPPCTENLTFFLLKTPIKFSAEQITEFARRYPMPNARDIQELNGRPIENR